MAEWETDDLRTAALSNQKNVYVMASAPTTAYDGQVWVCTSSDPPLVKVYDATNTQWMDHHQVFYETVTSGQMPATTPILNGAVAVTYDTEQSSTTLYARANGSWRDMGGALTRVYPAGDVAVKQTRAKGANDAGNIANVVILGSGDTTVLTSTNITPTNSGDVICLFGGGSCNVYIAPMKVRLVIGTVEVASHTLGVGIGYQQLQLVSSDVASNISTNVYMDVQAYQGSGAFHDVGLSMAAITVKT